ALFFAAVSARCFAVAVCFGFTLAFGLAAGFGFLAAGLVFAARFGFAAGFGFLAAGLALAGTFARQEPPHPRSWRLGLAAGALLLVTLASALPAASAAAASSATFSALGAASSTGADVREAPLPFPFSDSTTRATALTRSPFFRFITRTPWVGRPICEM